MTRDSNDLLNVACYSILAQYEAKTATPPSGLFFNKALSLMNHELEPSLPIGLPHCWYRWGDEVVRSLMPTSIVWNHEDPPRTSVTWQGDPPYTPGSARSFDLIARKAEQIIESYANPGGLDGIVNRVYSYAPFPFQDAFRNLRTLFIDYRGMEVRFDDVDTALFLPTLHRAMAVFPAPDFPVVGGHCASFALTMERLVVAGRDGLELARELSEAFWYVFCYYLRLHPNAHGSVPRATLDYWSTGLEQHLEHYEGVFRGILIEAANRIPTIPRDASMSALIGDATRVKEEDLAFIASFDKELDDLGRFMKTMRSKRGSNA